MKRIAGIVALIVALAMLGAACIRTLTGKSWLESLYMAVITLTTVGSRDIAQGPHASELMVFSIVYLLCGLSVFTYAASNLGQLIVNAKLQTLWERRRMNREINSLKGHFIVCGLGRMGTAICEYLSERRRAFVVIDRDASVLESICGPRKWLHVVGDSTQDEILLAAGIKQARSLSTVLATDADNVYVVLTARMLSSNLQIVARASEPSAVQKLERAGATRVISPFSSGAVKMARFMLSPSIEDFLEITDHHGGELELADVQITESSPYLGKRLADTDLREKGVMVIGIRRANGEKLLPPPGTAVIQVGDSLFAFGSSTAVNEMIGEIR